MFNVLSWHLGIADGVRNECVRIKYNYARTAAMSRWLVALIASLAPRSVALVYPTRVSRFALSLRAISTSTEEDLATMLLASARDDGKLVALIEDKLDEIDHTVMRRLMDATKDDANKDSAQRAIDALREAADRRLVGARELLESVLDAGELLEMDRRLVKLFKDGLVDGSFMAVLNMNVAAARECANDDASEQRARVMEHLYTRVQEEWEKRCDNQANAVLHRLTRTEQAVIRRNILEYYLAPQTEILVPNGDPIPLDQPRQPRISSSDFATAVATAVERLHAIDADPVMIKASIEECRVIAKEARLVIMERLPPEELGAFEDNLMATFSSQT